MAQRVEGLKDLINSFVDEFSHRLIEVDPEVDQSRDQGLCCFNLGFNSAGKVVLIGASFEGGRG